MNLLIEWAIYAAIAAAVAFGLHTAWTGAKEHIAAPYVADQIKADQKVVDSANKERDEWKSRAANAQADTKECTDKLDVSNHAVDRWKGEADANMKAAQSAKAANLIASAKARETQAGYLAIVNDKTTKAQTCEQKLGATDKLLRDAARARMGAK